MCACRTAIHALKEGEEDAACRTSASSAGTLSVDPCNHDGEHLCSLARTDRKATALSRSLAAQGTARRGPGQSHDARGKDLPDVEQFRRRAAPGRAGLRLVE